MSRPVRIVLVEDNPADVLLLKETLRQMGTLFTLEHYANGEDAANAIAAMTGVPDLFLLDVNIPRMNGLELLTLIRGHEATATATVAIFTSSQAPDDRTNAERLGADDYIVKPLGYYEFMDQVGPAVQRLLEAKTSCRPDDTGSMESGRATEAFRATNRQLNLPKTEVVDGQINLVDDGSSKIRSCARRKHFGIAHAHAATSIDRQSQAPSIGNIIRQKLDCRREVRVCSAEFKYGAFIRGREDLVEQRHTRGRGHSAGKR